MALALVCLASGWLLHIEHAQVGREQDASRRRIVDPVPEAPSDERAPRRVVIPWELKVVGLRCDLSSSALLDVLLDKGVSDCDNWEHVLVFDGESAMVPPGAMLLVEPRSASILDEKILAWHEAHGALIRLDCSAPDLPPALRHVECDAPIGDMAPLTELDRLESVALTWSLQEEARVGMAYLGEDDDAYVKKGKALPYNFDNFGAIESLTSLERLWLDPSDMDSDRLAAILELDSLTWLELLSPYRLGTDPAISGGAWISQIGNLPNLRTLVLDGRMLTDSDLIYLADLHELRALSLEGLQRSCPPNDHLGHHFFGPGDQRDYPCRRKQGSISFVKKLASLEHLHYLSLKDTKLEGHFIEDVRHLEGLRALSIQVDEAAKLRLGALTHLEALTLTASEPRIPRVGCTLGFLDQERLDYFNQETKSMTAFMTAWNPEWIEGLSGLKVVEMEHLKMRDEDARALASQQPLHGLVLVDSSVHDAILQPEALSTTLMTLTLDRTCVTEVGHGRARDMVPSKALTIRPPHGSREIEHHRMKSSGEVEVVRREERTWFDDHCGGASTTPRDGEH